jgi:hypothetical protein
VLSSNSGDNLRMPRYSTYNDGRIAALAMMARIVLIVPLAVLYFLLYLYRRLGRWHVSSSAQSWPAADAVVNGSYELDENQSLLSVNGWSIDADDDDEEYKPRLIVALQYTYQAEGELYSGTYFLPGTYSDGNLSSEDAHAWIARKIIVRYNPAKAARSFFLEQDALPANPTSPECFPIVHI